MSNALIVEIVEGHNTVQSRTYEDRTSYWIDAYAHNGNAFPVKFKIPVNDDKTAIPVGKYELMPTAFKTDKYDGLEIDRFQIFNSLFPLSNKEKAKA